MSRTGTSRGRTTTVVVLVVLVPLVAALAWWQPWVERAEPGQVFDVASGSAEVSEALGDRVELVLPSGATVDAEVGRRQERLPEHAGDEAPPRGGSFLPISVGLPLEPHLTTGQLDVPDGGTPSLEVRVTAGDVPVPVPRDGQLYYVAVAGASGGASVTVTFDGESQTAIWDGAGRVSVDAGRFAEVTPDVELEAWEDDLDHDCGEPELDGTYHRVEDGGPAVLACRLAEVYRTPWVNRLGWAPDGQVWAVGHVDFHALSAQLERRNGARTEAVTLDWDAVEGTDTPPPEVRVAGADAAAFATRDDELNADSDLPWRFVAAVDAAQPLPEAEITYGFPIMGAGGDRDGYLRATWTEPLEDMR
ncbi:hypothetical protein [Georgenia alba]|uniref:Uncharacterized protein n=1 Tax=Georgenia alba TaxID=2233858 RepID=A0ABW2QBM7_9MICO